MDANYLFAVLVISILALSRFIKPKKINGFIGYRTPFSMKNQNTWDYANSYSMKCLAAASIATLLFFAIINYSSEDSHFILMASVIFYASSLILIVPITEIYLRRVFDKNGKLK